MAAPLVASFWMRAAFSLVDTFFARTIGDHAVAAIGLAVPFEFIGIAIWVGLSTGLTAALARAMGAREGANIRRALRAARTQVLCVIPPFVGIGAAIALGAFDAPLGLPGDVSAAFRSYGGVLIGGLGLTVFWSVIPDSIVKAYQDMRATMWAGIVSNLGNLVLNTLFLFGFGWGVFGLGLATSLSRLGGLVYALRVARAHEERREAAGGYDSPHVEPHPHRAMLALALPSAAAFVLMAAENAVVNVLLAGAAGAKEQIAAFSIYHRTSLFAFQPAIAVGVAMLPFAALRFGRRDIEGMRAGYREALRGIALYVLLGVGPAALLGAPWIARALAEGEETRAATSSVIRLIPLMVLCGAPFAVTRPLFEGMRRGAPGLVVAIARYVLLSAPGALAGAAAARALGWQPVVGVASGLVAIAAVASGAFLLWARRALAEAERDAALRVDPGARA